MVDQATMRADAIKALLPNYLPTYQQFLNSLTTAEQNAFVSFFFTDPKKGGALVYTRIRQLAETAAATYVDAQIAAGNFPIADVQQFFT